jgi:SET domain-containing protein
MSENYRPLPDCLTIKNSSIEGLGLFATQDIDAGTNLGASHIQCPTGELIRTPLGGFYNHSANPNTVRARENSYHSMANYKYELTTLRDIKAGEEITVEYTLYNPE